MNRNKKNRGFTLIELLIVITIIGILASVVLVSLNSATKKAKIVSIKSSLNSIVVIAQMCHNGNGVIQGGYSGNNICNKLSITNMKYPLIVACGKDMSDEEFTVLNGNKDNWQIVLSKCSKVVNCVGATNAYCNVSGCHFSMTGSCW